MAVKLIDIKACRTLGGPRLVSSMREPQLSVLLRSKVTEGPLAPARISAPPSWDGICYRMGERHKTLVRERIPGRYVWRGDMWHWTENERPGMHPGETEPEYDARIEAEAEQEGIDVEDYKARIARETGESSPPR